MIGENGTILRTTNGGDLVSVDEPHDQPDVSPRLLQQNSPNSVNETTGIGFTVTDAGPVVLDVTDVLGQQLSVLMDSDMQPGSYTEQFDTQQLPNGVYYYRIRLGTLTETKKLLVMR